MKKLCSIIPRLIAIAIFACINLQFIPITSFALEKSEVYNSTTTIDYKTLSPNEQLIYDSFNSINNGDWSKWASYYSPAVRGSYLNFATTESNKNNNIGILTVNAVDVLDIQKVDNAIAPKYPELETYFQTGNYECYKVAMDLSVNENTKYFNNGYQERLVILVKENNVWGIGASCRYAFTQTRGVGYGFLTGDVDNPPSTITVDQHDNSTWSAPSVIGDPIDVDFNDFVENVVCGEIGNLSYNSNAVKAITVSDIMFSWWCVLGSYRDTYGCDIVGGYDVAFSPDRDVTSFPSSVRTSIASALGNYVVSSGGKFFSVGANNFTGYDYAGSGHVVQSGANALAGLGYTWQEILHYYLDNSSYNWPNAGIVIIG